MKRANGRIYLVNVNCFNTFTIAAINYRLFESGFVTSSRVRTHRVERTFQSVLESTDIKRFSSFLITIRFILNSRQFDGIKERTKEREMRETRGYIDLWRGWISDPRKVYRADDDALRSKITCRRLYANFTGRVSPRGINRPSFKPSALLVLPFLNLLTASSIDAASEGISPRYA